MRRNTPRYCAKRRKAVDPKNHVRHAAIADGLQNGSPSATYFRAALTPTVGSWDLGAGFQSWSGSANVGSTGAVTLNNTEAWAVDGQAQGAIGDLPLGIYLSHAKADGTTGGTANLFNSNPNAKSATAIAAELGILPHKATLMLAYRKGDNGKVANNGDNAWTLGGTYQIVQNIQLQLNYSKYSGSAFDTVPAPANGDQLVTLMLFGSF
jgi:predicted porin